MNIKLLGPTDYKEIESMKWAHGTELLFNSNVQRQASSYIHSETLCSLSPDVQRMRRYGIRPARLQSLTSRTFFV